MSARHDRRRRSTPARPGRGPGAVAARARERAPATETAQAEPRGWRAKVPWALLGALGLLPLLWASRTPTLGMPVADDYLFLWRLAFEHPLDWLGPMGAANYWRPVSRQLYYLLVGPSLLRAPWIAAALAALLLLLLYALLYRLARRAFAPPLAAAIACFPLVAEPSSVLLDWPSAAQHLLGALFAAWAVERAVAGRVATASIAALLALLSNEAAFVVLPALPLVGWLRTRSRRDLVRFSAGALAAGAIWAVGYAVARTHGMGVPAGGAGGLRGATFTAVLVQSLAAQLGIEGVPARLGPLFVPVFGMLAAAAVALSLRRAARERIRRAAPVLLGGLAWFAFGVAPLVFVLPDWNAWRTTVASLGLAFALTGWLGLAEPALAAALVALRVLVLLLAPPAPAVVTTDPPRTGSSFSLARLVRLQRVVESTRRTLRRTAPVLPRGAVVRYWQIPLLAEVGFNGNRAIQVWYRDTTLVLRTFGEAHGMSQRADAVVEIEPGWAWPAVRISPEAVRCYREAYLVSTRGDPRAVDSLLDRARRAQREPAPAFLANLAENRAQIAFRLREYSRADSLNRVAYGLAGPSGPYWVIAARLALERGDRQAARIAVRNCLALDPNDPDGRALAPIVGSGP